MDDLGVAVTDRYVAVTDQTAPRAARKLAQARVAEARAALGRELSRVHLAPAHRRPLGPSIKGKRTWFDLETACVCP